MVASAICLFNPFLLSCNPVGKIVDLLRKLQNVLRRTSKLFKSRHLDNGDITHDQAYNFAFHQKLESCQYNASLAISGTIGGTSKKDSTGNWVLNHFNEGDGTENFAALL